MTRTQTLLRRLLIALPTVLLVMGAPVLARAEMLNCVQFVKKVSPVALHGDAHQWWDAADGHYGRGNQPRPGSVMVFAKTRHLPHGHVAVVGQQLDNRTLLIDHANWSRFSGHRGRVEHEVKVVDVSPHNDWSQVRVWYHSLSDVGQTIYSVRGFVYPRGQNYRHHY